MARINIPENHLSGFITIGDLELKEFDKLSDLFKGGLSKDTTPKIQDIVNWIAEIKETKHRHAIEAILGMISFRYRQNDTSEVFFKDFYSSLSDQLQEKDFGNAEKIAERVQLLYDEAIVIRRALKATSLLYESEHVYDSCRVISDIRLLFDDEDPSLECEHAIIIHRLKLARRDADGQKELYVSLTRSQLQEIKQHIDRALKKEDQMRKSGAFTFIEQ